MMHRLLALLLLGVAACAHLAAEDFYRSYLVKPGKLDLGLLTDTAQIGDW